MNLQKHLASLILVTFLISSGLIQTNEIIAQVKIGMKATSPTVSAKASTREYWEPTNRNHYILSYQSTKNNFSFGMSFFHEMNKAFVMTDVLFRKNVIEYQLEIDSGIERELHIVEDEHQIVTVPVVAGYRKKNVKFGLGPVFNIKADSSYGLLEYEGFNLQSRKVNKGIMFLLGVTIKDFVQLDLRHELSLDSVGDDYNIVGNSLKIHSHSQSFSVSVGIYL